MPAVVESVEKGSVAQEVSLQKGDVLLKINDVVPADLIDYRFLINAQEVVLEVQKADNTLEIIEIEKDYDDDLGIVFENAVFDKIKKCTNNCIFCFVDQQPEGMRESLYVKDDDYRLSYLQGTYITLTNLTKKDKERIKNLRLGPLYVSLHTTNPELRAKMLKNPKAARIMDDLRWFQKYEIPLHLQIVLCPDYNDSDELDRTFSDLIEFKDIILSVAVVPVGVTRFRKKPLKQVDKAAAIEVINSINTFNKKIKKNIACASDEFFLLAEEEIPQAKYYGNFAQLDDGVGSLRLLADDFEKNKKKLPKEISAPKTLCLLTSGAAGGVFENIKNTLNQISNLSVILNKINCNFWGKDVNVAGLVTGTDILEQLSHLKGKIDFLVLPSIMLRAYSQSFLDDITVADIEKALKCKIYIIENIYSTLQLVNFIKSL